MRAKLNVCSPRASSKCLAILYWLTSLPTRKPISSWPASLPASTRVEELLPRYDHYQLVAEAFAEAVLNGTPVPLPPEDSIRNMKVLDAWTRSVNEGRDVAI